MRNPGWIFVGFTVVCGVLFLTSGLFTTFPPHEPGVNMTLSYPGTLLLTGAVSVGLAGLVVAAMWTWKR